MNISSEVHDMPDLFYALQLPKTGIFSHKNPQRLSVQNWCISISTNWCSNRKWWWDVENTWMMRLLLHNEKGSQTRAGCMEEGEKWDCWKWWGLKNLRCTLQLKLSDPLSNCLVSFVVVIVFIATEADILAITASLRIYGFEALSVGHSACTVNITRGHDVKGMFRRQDDLVQNLM